MARDDARRNDPHSRAVDTLIRAGRKAEIADLYGATAKRALAAYAAIREDEGRTPEWKAEQLDRTYNSFRAEVITKVVEKARSADADDQRDAAQVFGVRGLPGDAASLAISARDAADRVAQTSSVDDLRDLLERATRVGDEVLARAVAQRAVDIVAPSVLNDFAATREHLRPAAERLWSRARRGDEGSMDLSLRLLGIKP